MSLNELVVNYHMTEACNYRCGYCYAHWNENPARDELHHRPDDVEHLLRALAGYFFDDNPLRRRMGYDGVRLNFAGGEPMLLGDKFNHAAALYWPALGQMLKHGWSLPKRIRRPPTDPVNVCLSLTAAMLTRDVQALVLRCGLHPGFGVLHGSRDGHMGCVFDLVEEFRAPLAEGLCVYLFNNRILKQADFLPGTDPQRPVNLSGDARRSIIRTYEQWLDRPVKSPRNNRPVVWRRLMEEQILAYAAHCRGQEEYAPYRMDY